MGATGRKTTDAKWREFGSYGTRTAGLRTVRAGGSPHVTPVRWQAVAYDNGGEPSRGGAVQVSRGPGTPGGAGARRRHVAKAVGLRRSGAPDRPCHARTRAQRIVRPGGGSCGA
ncbi:hypothetical protein GCM10010398_12200 [Streptomyces fimbriatus]